ncbi:hypothetical protein LR48_Vigan11g173300 [Vigna angularis]|uniref:TIR domain-containing protein n=1 Tax=Phaseolus angularis TaxID=3914 RepID=A0A0L9VV66_PHAAN|nr:hypothetical protein LR48_Vigan11g173300 [Vigna angularis]
MEFASSSLSSSSSSFLTSEPHFIHDVFINFGGEEIGRRFVSHLHSVLLQAQVKTFISQENLHDGMKLEEHMRAIGHTKITIIVFSKSYTESACCLLELEKIIECHETFGQIVLPVFYEIDPLDVRHQKDDFGKALEDTAYRTYSGEQLQHARSRWSSALNRVAGMTGWDDRDFRYDAELVERIGTEAILSLKLDSSIRDCFEAHAFKEMQRLRLLQLDHVQLSGDCEHISKQLRWICWRGFPYKCIPKNFHLENVIAMDLKHKSSSTRLETTTLETIPDFRAVKIP